MRNDPYFYLGLAMKINLGWDKITENPRSGARTIDDFGIPEIKDVKKALHKWQEN